MANTNSKDRRFIVTVGLIPPSRLGETDAGVSLSPDGKRFILDPSVKNAILERPLSKRFSKRQFEQQGKQPIEVDVPARHGFLRFQGPKTGDTPVQVEII